MILLPPFLLLLCWFLSLFGRSMPFTMFGLSACLLAVIVALVLDEMYSRGPLVNEELQNRFWGYVTFFSTAVLFYSPDSPIGFGTTWRVFALCVSCGAGGLSFMLDRYISKQGRRKPSALAFSESSQTLPPAEVYNAKQLRSKIDKLLKDLDCNPALKFRYRSTILAAQESIVRELRNASRIALNYILSSINLQNLFYKVRDQDLPVQHGHQDNYRTQLVELLCTTSTTGGRLSELDIRSRALIIATLQESNLMAQPSIEALVVNAIKNTSGHGLTNLKMLLDDRCSVQSLHKLIWHDIKNQEYQEEVIDHIKAQGNIRRFLWREVTQKAMEVARSNWLKKGHVNIDTTTMAKQRRHRKILSDVDDTFFSSGGRFPAGCDTSYPRHVLYPGVLSVYRELDVAWNSRNERTRKGRSGRRRRVREPGNLSFLSARPHVYRDVVEKSAFKRFKELIAGGRLHCAPTMLAGSLVTGGSMFFGDYGPMSRTKFVNFQEFHKLWPECSFIFIGDNGQGDVRVGEMMMEHFPDCIDGIFIHLVQPLDQTPGYIKGVSEQKWKTLNIFFFRTYVGFAVESLKRNLINEEGMERIYQTAREEFSTIDFTSDLLYQQALNDFNRDIAEANDWLHVVRAKSNTRRRPSRFGDKSDGGRASGIYFPFFRPKASMVLSIGDNVVTCFGHGMVGTIEKRARPLDGIVTVRLCRNVARFSTDKTAYTDIRVYAPSSALRRVTPLAAGTPVLTTFGTGVIAEVRPDDNIHIVTIKHMVPTTPLNSVTKAYLNKRDILKVLQAAVGDRVKTMLGEGIVVDYRKSDNIYVIKLGRGKQDQEFWSTLYTTGDKLEKLPEVEERAQCVLQ